MSTRSGRAGRSGRAQPLSPDERRDQLVSHYIEFTTRTRRAPTTKELAELAGVAEGTIFRVYPTKDEVAVDALNVAGCPAPLQARLAAMDPAKGLTDVLVQLARISQSSIRVVFALMVATGSHRPPGHELHGQCLAAGAHVRTPPGPAASSHGSDDRLIEPAVAIVERFASELRVPAREVVQLVRMLAISAVVHSGLSCEEPPTPEGIVDALLNGVRR